MMLRSRKKTLAMLFALCAILLAGALWAGIPRAHAMTAEEVALDEVYFRGQELELPKATVTVDETEVDATAVLCFPSGRANGAPRQTLSEIGKYRLEYRATVQGKLYTETRVFEVRDRLFEIVGEGSAEYDAGTGGLKVSLASNAQLVFHKKVNPVNWTVRDVLFAFSILPETVGERDFETLVLTLTDAGNADNFVQIRYCGSPDAGYASYNHTSYASARYGAYPYTGFNGSNIWQNARYGRNVRLSFNGMPVNNAATEVCRLYYDYKNAELYTYGSAEPAYGGMICSLTEERFFPHPFGGFSDQGVLFSISAENLALSASSANFAVHTLAGVDLAGENEIEDETAPEITVDFGDYEENDYPSGAVGAPYPIFGATAKDDLDENPEVRTFVYKNYSTPIARSLMTIENGTFTPTSAGIYTAVYRARDAFGRTSEKCVPIPVYGETEATPLAIAVADISEKAQGETVAVPVPQVTGDDRMGARTVSASIWFEGEFVCEAGETYLPLRAGNYEIRYIARDFAGRTKTESAAFAVRAGNGALIDPESLAQAQREMPDYFLHGSTYDLPAIYAFVFSEGEFERKPCTVSVTDASERTLEGLRYVPQIEQTGSVRIVYACEGADCAFEKTGIKASGESGVLFGEFFTGEGAVSVAKETCVEITRTTSGSVYFVNPIAVSNLEITFDVDASANALSGLDFVLRELDSETAVRISFAKKSVTATDFSVTGGKKQTLTGLGFFGNEKKDFIFGFDGNRFRIGSDTYTVYEDESGNPFTGFAKGAALLEIRFTGVSGRATLQMISLNNQTLSSDGGDWIDPRITVLGNLEPRYDKGALVTIPAGRAYDVVNGRVDVKLTVLDPSGNKVRAQDGTLLDGVSADREYVISADAYGSYSLRYAASDLSDNSSPYVRRISVVDREKPVLTLSGKISEKVKVGSTVRLPAATATDNLSENLQVYVQVLDPRNVGIRATDSFVAERRGKYIMRYYAIDETGNVGMLDVIVTAE